MEGLPRVLRPTRSGDLLRAWLDVAQGVHEVFTAIAVYFSASLSIPGETSTACGV